MTSIFNISEVVFDHHKYWARLQPLLLPPVPLCFLHRRICLTRSSTHSRMGTTPSAISHRVPPASNLGPIEGACRGHPTYSICHPNQQFLSSSVSGTPSAFPLADLKMRLLSFTLSAVSIQGHEWVPKEPGKPWACQIHQRGSSSVSMPFFMCQTSYPDTPL